MAVTRMLGAWLLALGVMVLPLTAQNFGKRHFAVLGPDQGVSSASVTCLTQDADGFIWMGTENGLLRYENGQSRRWTGRDGLPSSYISALLPAPGGGLWVATPGGLVRFRRGRLEPTSFGAESPCATSVSMALDGRGRLWAVSAKGLYVQQEDNHFELLALPLGGGLSTPATGVRSGALYLPWTGGLRVFQVDGTSRNWGVADGLPEGGPKLVVEDGAGRVWAGSGRTLVMKEPAGERFTDVSGLLGGSLTPNGVAMSDTDGTVWLPTQNGALHLDGEQVERLDNRGGLPFHWVRAVFRDREGALWVVGPYVARLLGHGRVWNYSLTDDNSGEVVWAITRDRDGTLLVGTDDGAARMGPNGLQRIPGTEGHRIKALARDRQGTLWMVGTIGPALWLQPGQSRAVVAPLGFLGTGLHSVLVDSLGRVWLSHSSQGVLRWDPASRKLVQEAPPALANAPVLGVYKTAEDAGHRLWAATSGGLLLRETDGRWHLFTAKHGLHPNSIHGLAFLPDGSAWLHFQEPLGLVRVRVTGEQLTILEQHTQDPGLRSNLIFAAQVDARGQTWVSTDQGLNRLDPPLHVGHADGMASEDCAINALLVEPEQVWVGTANGLVRYDQRGSAAPAIAPAAQIVQLSTNARQLEPPFGHLAPVPHREATLAFRLAAPAYARAHELHFQVRLRGLEEAWREPESTTVRYPALPGGRYRFEVRAALGAEPFGPVAGLDFSVRPPWWKTWWALLLESLLGAVAVYALVRIRVDALARSKAALEALVALRTQELSSRNAELSEALGNVKQLSGLLPICSHCKKIRDDGGYWNQLESYITRHADVDFSHGICPECVQRVYPEYAPRILDALTQSGETPAPKSSPNIGNLPK